MKNKILIILGMHRSGTSLLSNWLYECGLNLGENFRSSSQFNQKGYYEDIEFLNLHKKILSENNIHPSGYEELKNITLTQNQKKTIEQLVTKKNKNFQWGWKDPRTCLLIDYYKNIIPNAYFIVIFRNYENVVASLIKRDVLFEKHYGRNIFKKILIKNINYKKNRKYIEKFSQVWVYYNKRILKSLSGLNDNVIYLSYYDVLKKDKEIIKKLISWGFNLNFVPFDSVFEKKLISNKKHRSYKPSKKTYRAILDITERFNYLKFNQ
jgi:hypothetical protein